jgi:hypothetical protein
MVRTASASVRTTKGALATVKTLQGNTYVRSISNLGTVFVSVENKTIALHPGEEMLISNHTPDASEVHPVDGLGRRNTQTTKAGQHFVSISDFSIITMLSSSESMAGVVHSKDESARRIFARTLKTAAAVDLVLRYRGAYSARAN